MHPTWMIQIQKQKAQLSFVLAITMHRKSGSESNSPD